MKSTEIWMEGRLVKKQSCRMTVQEKEVHKEAGKYRRMTDQQLVDTVSDLRHRAEKAEAQSAEMAALAEEREHETEIAQRAAAAAAHAMAEKVKEAASRTEGQKKGKEAVNCFLDRLYENVGTGNGIGRGTIFKLRKFLETMTDDDFATRDPDMEA